MNNKLIQKVQQATVNLQVAKARGKFKIQANKYEELRRELEEYKIFLQPSTSIKANNKSVGFKVLENPNDVVEVTVNGLDQLDLLLDSMIHNIKINLNTKNSKLLFDMLKIVIINRRQLKSKMANYATVEYYVKSKNTSKWIRNLNIKLPKGYNDTGDDWYYKNGEFLEKQDVVHLIEKFDTENSELTYEILKRLVEVS